MLVSLSVLIKEKNVTRAANTLYLSQPAMSRTLSRLRTLFDDPLFYRESNGLVPTQKTLELQAPLEELLLAMRSLVAKSAFDPAECVQTFVVSIPPLMSRMLTVPLAERFMQDAPNASLIEYPIANTPTSQLLSRDVDFTIHIEPPSNPIEFPYVSLGQIYPVFYVSANHPLAKAQDITLEQCLESRFVDLTLDIRSNYGLQHPVDSYLAKNGMQRDIAFKSGQLLTLVEVMQSSSTILVATHKLIELEGVGDKIVPIFSLDKVPELMVELFLIEHKRTITSPAHQWFKNLVVSVIEDVVCES
ncbi:LysR family transcriptional regulator [Shewanella sp. TC10]|uniref:LysR family transcriptional regulator n=1 Tax=Shewanella sp. TC10 TaxID=1419739 RepID=UPI001E334CFD|nr:LysR family transcriptional regulator [Shewanella sp. TC10]